MAQLMNNIPTPILVMMVLFFLSLIVLDVVDLFVK